MRTKRVVGWIAVASLVIAVGGFGLARAVDSSDVPRGLGWAMHGGGFPGLGPMRGLLHDLDLTEEQRSQLRTIARTAWEQSADERSELQALRRQIESTVIANGFNEAEIQGIIDSKGMLLNDMLLDVVRAMADMRNVLTPEQLRRFAERRAEFEARREAYKIERSREKQ
jgi:Spy/CpxP family protein refolding chaperone